MGDLWTELVEVRDQLEQLPEQKRRLDELFRKLAGAQGELSQRKDLLSIVREEARAAGGLGGLLRRLLGSRAGQSDAENVRSAEASLADFRSQVATLEQARKETERAIAEATRKTGHLIELLARARSHLAGQGASSPLFAALDELLDEAARRQAADEKLVEAMRFARTILASVTPATDALQQANRAADLDARLDGGWLDVVLEARKYGNLAEAKAHLGGVQEDLDRLNQLLAAANAPVLAGTAGTSSAMSEPVSPTMMALDVLVDGGFDHAVAARIDGAYGSAGQLEHQLHALLGDLNRRRATLMEVRRGLLLQAVRVVEQLRTTAT